MGRADARRDLSGGAQPDGTRGDGRNLDGDRCDRAREEPRSRLLPLDEAAEEAGGRRRGPRGARRALTSGAPTSGPRLYGYGLGLVSALFVVAGARYSEPSPRGDDAPADSFTASRARAAMHRVFAGLPAYSPGSEGNRRVLERMARE